MKHEMNEFNIFFTKSMWIYNVATICKVGMFHWSGKLETYVLVIVYTFKYGTHFFGQAWLGAMLEKVIVAFVDCNTQAWGGAWTWSS